MPRHLSLVCALSLITVACGPTLDDPAPQVAIRQAALTQGNGSNLNGSNLNGSNLNGTDLASTLASVSLVSVQVNGYSILDHAELQGTVFHGWKGSSYWSGTLFYGAEFNGTMGDGRQVKLRVDAVTPGTAPHADVWTYRVSYFEPANQLWWPICKDDQGAIDAIPVSGRWDLRQGVAGGGAKIADSTAFTFGCVGRSAIAKCVMAGYKPWASANGVSLDRHHQACVRLIRADFCGDGKSHTTNGQWVNLYDGVGVQQDTEHWVPEAEWDEHGARCFYPLNRSHEAVPCYDQRQDLGCGASAHFSTGTLLINETPEDGILDPLL